MNTHEYFPDGTPVDGWFYDTAVPTLDELGRQYVLTDHDIWNDGHVCTDKIQALIDKASQNGGGVIVVPSGVFKTGALFFKQGVNLYIERGGVLLGSDDISDYPVIKTRIEGETCMYYPALINADGVDGFVMCGKGTIDGNGYRSWRAFWLRREWNPDCTNKDEQRPRLVYISNSRNVTIAGLSLQNSHFWTTHIYRCERVKYIGCRITSQARLAPSTDAVDIDACRDVLIKDSYMAVNDDAVVMKGGKGPWA
ncbi:MAG: exopolygalacturonase, partial [Clostridia bacterium]|nr:exopolygalacturonase [Clostridia bacterium]